MTTTLVSPDSTMVLWAILAVLTVFGFWAETRWWGQRVSGVALVVAISFALSNLNIIPQESSVYDITWSYFIPFAVPLLLLQADLRRILRESGPMLMVFFAGAVGTVLGAIIGFKLLPMGDAGSALAGMFAASYIGGSMNFAAVASALHFDAEDVLAAAVAADSVAGTLYLLFLAVLPGLPFLKNAFGSSTKYNGDGAGEAHKGPVKFDVVHLTMAIALSLCIFALSEGIMRALGEPDFTIVAITAFSVLAATIVPRHVGSLSGGLEFGMILMYFFFAATGAQGNLMLLLELAPVLLMFLLILLLVHFVVIISFGRLLKVPLAETVIASNACALGPATAAALAGAQGWRTLITPGVLCGTLGYAIANFIGLGLARLL